ncbi:hypothetical protein XCR_4239 [Xanthomonas campestris pv. raphani 756C]|nr:hypothetical protein XCR_4239 [Xanthomonas campestris pv. raphani 756C]
MLLRVTSVWIQRSAHRVAALTEIEHTAPGVRGAVQPAC